MRGLDSRLALVAQQIQGDVHADIGSDHGYLLRALLQSRQIRRGIAIENKRGPFANSKRGLAGLAAEIRFGDGLEPLQPGEADSVSLCGMGARLIVQILQRHPERLPDRLVVQPNTEPERIRQWAWHHHYHLEDEQLADSQRLECVLCFRRGKPSTDDPAYTGLDPQLAVMFGPWQLRRRDAHFLKKLRGELQRLEALSQLTVEARHRQRAIRRVLTAE